MNSFENETKLRSAYHLSNIRYEVGDFIPPYDCFPGLHPSNHAAENLIRSGHTAGQTIRSNAIYLWEDEVRARQQWRAAGRVGRAQKYLYTVVFDDADLMHRGDLNHYTDVRSSKNPESVAHSVEYYWAGRLHGVDLPRVELLVSKAVVVSLEPYKAPTPMSWSDDDLPFLQGS